MAIIKIENLSKKYIIGHDRAATGMYRYHSLRDSIAHTCRGISRRIRHPLLPNTETTSLEEFWALKDINLEIEQGDKVGIIGANGAGKTTLLKILSRITEPTTGKFDLKGRVASLLEVGTGFHPELSGRENIYLNGAILGMTRKEIKKKFDEIVDFAGVEKFLDTPVKRYSSGMYVRLAFAVAAHLEPEILLIDEVLAVGDAEFQKKCLGKMEDVSKQGRTILFVSHNMGMIKQLCNKATLLKGGSILFYGNVQDTIHHYLSDYTALKLSSWENTNNLFQNEYFTPLSIRIVDKNGIITKMPIQNNEDYYLEIKADIEVLHNALTIGYCIYTEEDQQLYWSYQTDTQEDKWPILKKGTNILRTKIPKKLLNEGSYKVELIGGLHFIKWLFEPRKNNPFIYIEIQGGLSNSPYMTHKRPTLLSPILEWQKIDV